MRKSEFFTLFSRAWKKAATVEIAQNGFRGTGMYPVNLDAIHADVYEPSKTTERAQPPANSEPWALTVQETTTHTPAQWVLAKQAPSVEAPAQWVLAKQAPSAEAPAALALAEQASTSMADWSPGQVQEDSWIGAELELNTLQDNVTENRELGTENDREDVTFSSLIATPTRERGATRKRAKPPSYHLTSDEHFKYIGPKSSASKESCGKKKYKKSLKVEESVRSEGNEVCRVCKKSYGDKDDPKKTEEWIMCVGCKQWLHESCGEDFGVIEDGEIFTCSQCLP